MYIQLFDVANLEGYLSAAKFPAKGRWSAECRVLSGEKIRNVLEEYRSGDGKFSKVLLFPLPFVHE